MARTSRISICKKSIREGAGVSTANGASATLDSSPGPLMKLLLAAVAIALVAPAAARAEVASIVSRDVSVGARGGRPLAAATPVQPRRAALAGDGCGRVPDARASPGGGAPGGRRRPRTRTGRTARGRAERPGWRLGNPYWIGASDRLEVRTRGAVRRVRAHYVWSPVGGNDPSRPRTLAVADDADDRPAALLGRERADQARYAVVRGVAPVRRRPPHGRHERVHARAVGGDRARDPALPRARRTAGTTSATTSSSTSSARSSRAGSAGSRRTSSARTRRGSTPVRPAWRCSAPTARRGSRPPPAPRSCGCSRGASTSRTSTRCGRSTSFRGATRASRAACRSSCAAISGHRDTGFTDCPGDRLYAALDSLARDVGRTGLPKIYEPVVAGHAGRACPLHRAALGSRCRGR